MIILPGLHINFQAADYHADPCANPSLSSSLAKVILGKTPKHAFEKHPRLNPNFKPEADEKFVLGSVVHELMLGRGGGIEIINADTWQTKAAKQARDDARAAGLTPILAHQCKEANRIAISALAALREIPGCESFFDPYAQSEAVIVCEVPNLFINPTGVTVLPGTLCRVMLDRFFGPNVWDVKTTGAGLSDDALGRSIVNLGYDLSAAFYLKVREAVFPCWAGRQVFRWIFVETEPPYDIRVKEADATTLHFGDRKASAAIAKWNACLANNEWPGWPRVVTRSEYPAWAESAWLGRELEELCD